MATRADPLRNTLDHLALDPKAKEDRHYLVTMLRRLGYSEVEIAVALGEEVQSLPEHHDEPIHSETQEEAWDEDLHGPRVIEVEYTGAKDPSVYELIRPGEIEMDEDGNPIVVGTGEDEDDGLDHDSKVEKGKAEFEDMFGFDDMDDDDLDFDSWGTDVEKAFDDDEDDVPFDLQTVTAELAQRLRNAGQALKDHTDSCSEPYHSAYGATGDGLIGTADKLTDIDEENALDVLRDAGISLQEGTMAFEPVGEGTAWDPNEGSNDMAEGFRNAGSSLQTAEEAEDALGNCDENLISTANSLRDAADMMEERGSDCPDALRAAADALDPIIADDEDDMFADDGDLLDQVDADVGESDFEEWDGNEVASSPLEEFEEETFNQGEASDMVEFIETGPMTFIERSDDPALRAGWIAMDEDGNPIVPAEPADPWEGEGDWGEEPYVHDGYTLYHDDVETADGPFRRYFFSDQEEPEATPSPLPADHTVETDGETGVPFLIRTGQEATAGPRRMRIMRVSAETPEEAQELLRSQGKDVKGAVALAIQETEEWE